MISGTECRGGQATTRRREDGQVIVGLVLAVVTLLGGGILLLQVGRAADLRAEAVTAADAAALAAASDLREQMLRDPLRAVLDDGSARASAADYAARNSAALVGYQRSALTVRAAVATVADLGEGAEALDAVHDNGEATATAEVEVEYPPAWPEGLTLPLDPDEVQGHVRELSGLADDLFFEVRLVE